MLEIRHVDFRLELCVIHVFQMPSCPLHSWTARLDSGNTQRLYTFASARKEQPRQRLPAAPCAVEYKQRQAHWFLTVIVAATNLYLELPRCKAASPFKAPGFVGHPAQAQRVSAISIRNSQGSSSLLRLFQGALLCFELHPRPVAWLNTLVAERGSHLCEVGIGRRTKVLAPLAAVKVHINITGDCR